jgi:hypothetical protein
MYPIVMLLKSWIVIHSNSGDWTGEKKQKEEKK